MIRSESFQGKKGSVLPLPNLERTTVGPFHQRLADHRVECRSQPANACFQFASC